MEIAYVLGSIVLLTWLVWGINNGLKFRVCPICAGVSLTWVSLAVGILLGYLDYEIYSPILAILIGGTAVGIGYQGEKIFGLNYKKALWFKLLTMLAGFTVAYLNFYFLSWALFLAEAAAVVLIGYFYFIFPYRELTGSDEGRKKYIEQQLKDCC